MNGVKETLQLSNGEPNNLKDINLTSNFFIGQSDGKRRLNGLSAMPAFGQQLCPVNKLPGRVAEF